MKLIITGWLNMSGDKTVTTGRDECEVCHGANDGVWGNENIIGGKIVCDYCHSRMMEREKCQQKQ
jgi:hypothetical protein